MAHKNSLSRIFDLTAYGNEEEIAAIIQKRLEG
jgi:hypothetical protein